jgi:hypothetical protein
MPDTRPYVRSFRNLCIQLLFSPKDAFGIAFLFCFLLPLLPKGVFALFFPEGPKNCLGGCVWHCSLPFFLAPTRSLNPKGPTAL